MNLHIKRNKEGVNSNVKDSRKSLIKSAKGRGLHKYRNKKYVSFDLKRVARLSANDKYELICSLKGTKRKALVVASWGLYLRKNRVFLC